MKNMLPAGVIFTTLLSLGYPAQAQLLRKMLEKSMTKNASETTGTAPVYSNLYYWAAHPDKHDPSDSIPSAIKGERISQDADVFFLHPTSFTANSRTAPWNADVNDNALNKQTDDRIMLNQASVFNGSCRVYGPRYRQAHLKAFYFPGSPQSKAALDLAYSDIKASFQYYLDHFNNDRPIIIASHSQGSHLAIRLLQDYFDGKPLQKKLVCAYVVGWGIKDDDLKFIKAGEKPDATGCIVSWRSYKWGTEDGMISRETGSYICVNPISWTRTSEETPKTLHKGSIGADFNHPVPGSVSASISPKGNSLWVKLPENFRDFGGINNYHVADYNLFWMDIRENAKLRVAAWFKGPH